MLSHKLPHNPSSLLLLLQQNHSQTALSLPFTPVPTSSSTPKSPRYDRPITLRLSRGQNPGQEPNPPGVLIVKWLGFLLGFERHALVRLLLVYFKLGLFGAGFSRCSNSFLNESSNAGIIHLKGRENWGWCEKVWKFWFRGSSEGEDKSFSAKGTVFRKVMC